MVKMNESGNSSPTNNDGSSSETDDQQQHVVFVHINSGATLSVRVGDDIQHFHGPAMVNMVPENGLPYPFPMQVPPGHVVQQIVDENNILTHVILSPQMGASPHCGGTPQNTTDSTPGVSRGAGGAQHVNSNSLPGHFMRADPALYYHSHHHPRGADAMGAAPPRVTTHTAGTVPVQLTLAGLPHNHRTEAMNNSPAQEGNRKPRRRPGASRDHHRSNNGHHGNSNHQDEKHFVELLKMFAGSASDVSARQARVRVECRLSSTETPDQCVSSLASQSEYELVMAEKSRQDEQRVVHRGPIGPTEQLVSGLKPYTAYCLGVRLGEQPVKIVTSFTTESDCPERPPGPKLSSRNKSSLLLKWNAASDNGAKITEYILESCDGHSEDGGAGESFKEIYKGSTRQHKVVKLRPSSLYRFRLAANNRVGRSEYSDQVGYWTTGLAPTKPDPPKLVESSSRSMTLSWVSRQSDDEFTLQMDDEVTGHGFMALYNGPQLSYTAAQLRRNSDYKLRLSATNSAGTSPWSDVVNFTTSPETPGPPPRPHVRNRVTPYTVDVTWGPPTNTGGTTITGYTLEADLGRGYTQLYRGNSQEFVCNRLKPGGVHKMRLACENSSGCSDWSEELTVTAPSVCPKVCLPPHLVGKAHSTSLCLQWSPPDDDGGAPVTGYELRLVAPDGTAVPAYVGPDTACTITDLLPGRPYIFDLKTANKVGYGHLSDGVEILTGPGPPDSPLPPACSAVSPHIILILWQEPPDNGAKVTEYKLEWSEVSERHGNGNAVLVAHTGPQTSYEVKSLPPATTHQFAVKALNQAGWSSPSDRVTCTTLPSTPGSVPDFRVSNPTAHSVDLTWGEPATHGSAVKSFKIDVTGDTGHSTNTVPGQVAAHTVDGLRPDTVYRFRVQAINEVGMGPFSSSVAATTRPLPPEAPALELVSRSANSIKLKWGSGKNVKSLKYSLQLVAGDKKPPLTLYQGTHQSHKVPRLVEDTEYGFCLYASNEAGTSPQGSIFAFRTTPAPPLTCQIDRVTEVTPTGCLVTWTANRPSSDLVFSLYVRDAGGRLAYRGSETSYQLSGLESDRSYTVRVNAARKHATNPADTASATVEFRTLPEIEKSEDQSYQSDAVDEDGGVMNERSWAAAILSLFALVAVLMAALYHNYVN